MKRIEYIDNWKGLGILLVVLTHTLGYTRHIDTANIFSWQIEAWIKSFIMPFFVFVNGYTFYEFYFKKSYITTVKIKHYLHSLWHIYLLFGTTMILVKWQLARYTVSKITISNLLLNFFIPDTSMWYIWFLIVITPIATILLRLNLSKELLVLLYLSFLALSILFGGPLNLKSHPLAIQHLTSLPLFYFVGIIFSKYNLLTRIQKYSRFIIFPLYLVTIGFLYTIFQLNDYPQTHYLWYTALRYLNAYAMIFIISYTLHRFSTTFRFLSWFGRHSLYIYLIHTYILSIFIILARRYLITLPNGLLIIIGFLSCLILSSCLSICITNIPALKRIFKGQWKI